VSLVYFAFSPCNLINNYSTLAYERKTAKINVKTKYSARAQKSQRENCKIILGLNPYDIGTGALT